MTTKIEHIHAEEIRDSRGTPTIRVTVSSGEFSGSFAVPSGASTGSHEAYELRDGDMSIDNGHGVTKVIENIHSIILPALVGQDVTDQKNIDDIMITLDGTPNKSRLGGNALIGVSIACAKLAARSQNLEVYEYLRTIAQIAPSRDIPYLYMNLINGGKHAKNGLAFQEYHVVPQGSTVRQAYDMGISIQNALEEIVRSRFGDEGVVLGDEGGFAIPVHDVRAPLVLLEETLTKAGLVGKVRFALDVAASSFYENGAYAVNDGKITTDELSALYASFDESFHFLSIEDPYYEEDFADFKNLVEVHKDFLVVGDDLTVTNVDRVTEAIAHGSITAMIIKPNQVGTLSETLATMKLAREHNIHLIISHRSGETDDDFIADLAFAFGCFGLKSGAPKKKERAVKYQRLLTISEK